MLICRCALFAVAAFFGLAAPMSVDHAMADEIGVATKLASKTELDQPVRSRDGQDVGILVDILVTPRSGQLVAVIQPQSSKFPIALPFVELTPSAGYELIDSTVSEINGRPKVLVVTGPWVESKRFGRLQPNVGLMAVASVPIQELRFPNDPTGPESYLRAQNNVDSLWRNAIKPF